MTPRRFVAALLTAVLALLLTGCRPSQPLDIGSDTPALDVVYGRPSPSDVATRPTSRPPTTSSAPTRPTTPAEAAQPTEAR